MLQIRLNSNSKTGRVSPSPSAVLVIGIPAAVWLTHLAASALYEVKPTDVMSYTSAVVMMIGISMLAALIPALRASKIQPVTALKHE